MSAAPDPRAEFITRTWRDDVLPALEEYIRIPNLSPAFAPGWANDGHMDRAVGLIADWCRRRPIPGLTVSVHTLPGRTPVVIVEIPATDGVAGPGPVLLYGHLDKQPPMTGWRDGLDPWIPVIEHGRLYGRGSADDGYAVFAALTAIEANHRAGRPHARCVVVIEASEESGSPDLPAHVEALADRIGTPSFVICLDSGCLDDERLWVTTSLRGLLNGTLEVAVLDAGVHSGLAGGLVPSSFRIARALLDRVEDSATGAILLPELHVPLPPDRRREIEITAAALAAPIAAELPFLPGVTPQTTDGVEQVIARTWRPALEVIGADGLPPTADAGNVLRPSTALTLSVRLPPTCDPIPAGRALAAALTRDPPSGAHVVWTPEPEAAGWMAPATAPWLAAALDEASGAGFGAPSALVGEGGSIPFMAMLGARFPEAQFAVLGVLGPDSNAHGPNEFLDLVYAEGLVRALTVLLEAHAASRP